MALFRIPAFSDKRQIALLNLGFAHALVSIFIWTGVIFHGYEPVEIARSLAATGHFANPFHTLPTGATAHLAPLYPALLALCLRVLGDCSFAFLAIGLGTCCLFVFVVCALPSLAARVFGNRTIGLVAAFGLVVLPIMQLWVVWESIVMAIGLIAYCMITEGVKPRPWLAGSLAAALCLLNPVALTFVAVWSFGLSWRHQWTFRVAAKAALLCVLLCLPWMMRNYLVLGTFCVRDDFGLELQLGNNNFARPSFGQNSDSRKLYSPNENEREAAKLATLGESEYNRIKLQSALDWIGSEPVRFGELTLRRCFYFWFPEFQSGPFSLGLWSITVLSIPAILRALRNRKAPMFLALANIAYSVPYLLVGADLRYRTPVAWVTALFAAETVYRIALRVRRTKLLSIRSLASSRAMARN